MHGTSSQPSVLMIHGAGGGGWEWTIWARVFAAAGWCVRAPDLEPADGGIAATRWEDYIDQVRHWGQPAPDALIGASLGGLLALCAGLAPRALVLVNPLPPQGLARAAPYPAVVPWGRERSLDGTRRAIPDADPAACLSAFRRWRDESGAVLNRAVAGVAAPRPACPVLVLASAQDGDVPASTSLALAREWAADVIELPGASHVGPLLGRAAPETANQVAAWLRRRAQPKAT